VYVYIVLLVALYMYVKVLVYKGLRVYAWVVVVYRGDEK